MADRRRQAALQAAADAHVEPMSLAVLASVAAAQNKIAMDRLEAACARGDADAAERAIEAALRAMEDRLTIDDEKAPTPLSLLAVMGQTVAAGAGAISLCIPAPKP